MQPTPPAAREAQLPPPPWRPAPLRAPGSDAVERLMSVAVMCVVAVSGLAAVLV